MRGIAILVVAVVLAGCSSIKTYPNTLSKNMHVTTKLDSGSRVTSTEAALDIYRVDASCALKEEGRVDLDDAKTEVGLPTNGRLYLEFIFFNHNYLLRSTSSTSHGLLFTPRPGYSYQAKAQYISGIYDVVIRESSGRILEHVTLNDCKPRI